MTLVNKIIQSFRPDLTVLYGNAVDLNDIVENVKIGNGVIVLMQEIVDSQLVFSPLQHAYCEQAETMLFFLTTSVYDRDSLENETRIEVCKKELVRWLLQFAAHNSDIRLSGDIRLSRVYEKTDTILTGLAVSLTIREDVGIGICG